MPSHFTNKHWILDSTILRIVSSVSFPGKDSVVKARGALTASDKAGKSLLAFPGLVAFGRLHTYIPEVQVFLTFSQLDWEMLDGAQGPLLVHLVPGDVCEVTLVALGPCAVAP